MGRKEKGMTYNSFYEIEEDSRTEEEFMAYKRLIGMPLAEDYDELIASLKTNVVRNETQKNISDNLNERITTIPNANDVISSCEKEVVLKKIRK